MRPAAKSLYCGNLRWEEIGNATTGENTDHNKAQQIRFWVRKRQLQAIGKILFLSAFAVWLANVFREAPDSQFPLFRREP
jgi:hypothetical protein